MSAFYLLRATSFVLSSATRRTGRNQARHRFSLANPSQLSAGTPLTPAPGVTISASIRANSTILAPDLQQLLPACDPARAGTAHHSLAGVCTATLDGHTAQSDVEGVATFDKLKFTQALPGELPAAAADRAGYMT